MDFFRTKIDNEELSFPLHKTHTLVIGSGAAGLNAAVQLHARGVEDVLIVTEGLQMGTSINTGSDKQTYYKLGMCGADADSPEALAETLFAGGSMHGDLALVEASLSARGFLNLVQLGVPFPQDKYGQFVGYKTDHDPRRRATSVGPYTSREMCRALIKEVARCGIPVHESRVVVALLVSDAHGEKRAVGAIAVHREGASSPNDPLPKFEVYQAENVVFAVGGPGGLYKTRSYPAVHTGAIGLALMAGAKAQGLPESQFGLASIGFPWNVSGTYMQVIPRFISTDAGGGDEREFLRPYFATAGQMHSMVFLKGYQWPFDPRKAEGGSSLIDILVFIETVMHGRRVFLDFRRNPEGFDFAELSAEALEYLTKSDALLETPIARLGRMNPGSIELYQEHGIDIMTEPLEIAVCAQHNNGGLAGDLWWESTNIKHLFPIGEVNGSHGVYRPGGSALNAGQVGAIRAADFIAHRYAGRTLAEEVFAAAAQEALAEISAWAGRARKAPRLWRDELAALQARMTEAGGHIRRFERLEEAVAEARAQWQRIRAEGCGYTAPSELADALHTRQLCLAHLAYLESILFAVGSGVGSRGSAMVLAKQGKPVHAQLGDDWRYVPENPDFRERVLETEVLPDGTVRSQWVPRRPLPHTDAWFETAWAAYKNGEIYE